MRYILELTQAPDGHVTGTVASPDGAPPMAFSGWLELLSLLASTGQHTPAQEAHDGS